MVRRNTRRPISTIAKNLLRRIGTGFTRKLNKKPNISTRKNARRKVARAVILKQVENAKEVLAEALERAPEENYKTRIAFEEAEKLMKKLQQIQQRKNPSPNQLNNLTRMLGKVKF